MIIYILECKNNKYYVGKTKDIERRFQEHKDGKGASWTKKYQPIRILEKLKTDSIFDEDLYVKKYMYDKGMNNVRGGSYSKIELTESEKKLLRKELQTAGDRCFICDERHLSYYCTNSHSTRNRNKYPLMDEYSYILLDSASRVTTSMVVASYIKHLISKGRLVDTIDYSIVKNDNLRDYLMQNLIIPLIDEVYTYITDGKEESGRKSRISVIKKYRHTYFQFNGEEIQLMNFYDLINFMDKDGNIEILKNNLKFMKNA